MIQRLDHTYDELKKARTVFHPGTVSFGIITVGDYGKDDYGQYVEFIIHWLNNAEHFSSILSPTFTIRQHVNQYYKHWIFYEELSEKEKLEIILSHS